MANLTVVGKINTSGNPIEYGQTLLIDSGKLIDNSTKSLYIRKGFMNGTLFLSQRGNGANGAGDICKIEEDTRIEVNSNLFLRIYEFANKSNAIIN